MSLPENTSYASKAAPYMQQAIKSTDNAVKSMEKFGKTLPSPKSIDVSKYRKLANRVSNSSRNVSRAPSSGPIATTNVGVQTTPYNGSTRYEGVHPGVDLANKIGTPIPSFTAGKVIGTDFGYKQGDKGYGNYVIVQDPQGNKHRYSHLHEIFVNIGDEINKGQEISTMGNTGSTYSLSGGTGSHLDYRVQDMYNKYVDPNQFIN